MKKYFIEQINEIKKKKNKKLKSTIVMDINNVHMNKY
jgi:hypothetical protein